MTAKTAFCHSFLVTIYGINSALYCINFDTMHYSTVYTIPLYTLFIIPLYTLFIIPLFKLFHCIHYSTVQIILLFKLFYCIHYS